MLYVICYSMRNGGLNAHSLNSTRATGSIVYIQAHFDLSGLISKAREQSAQSYEIC